MSPLKRFPEYRKLFLAQVLSLAGSGISTVALALLAYELAGDRAGAVLGTALALKMFAYVVLAPIMSAWVSRLPKKGWLVTLDGLRAIMVMLLPWVDALWQIYLLILLINACSAGFTPAYQALLPRVLPERGDYLKALSLSRLAYDLEQLLSPLAAALLLSLIGFRQLFMLDSLTFMVSGCLIFFCTLPQDAAGGGPRPSLTAGLRHYLSVPRLRSLWGAYLAVASASAMAIVNTVLVVTQRTGGGERETALTMAAMGLGSMLVALMLPRWLEGRSPRNTLLAGALLLTLALALAIPATLWPLLLALWFLLGIGCSLIQTPAGVLITASGESHQQPGLFAAHFSLTHLCWFATYLLAGWGSATLGLSLTFGMMAVLSLLGLLMAWSQGRGGENQVSLEAKC